MRYAFINLILLLLFFLPSCNRENISSEHQSSAAIIKNIEVFTRLYGYVKYFYPSDEAATLDWDAFALYGVKSVEKATNKSELKKILIDLFIPIAPALEIYDSPAEIPFSIECLSPPEITNNQELKVVAWQHQGLGFNSTDIMFKSIRLNRIDKGAFKNNNGFLFNPVDASTLKGKEIKLKASVKTAGGIAQLGLWVGGADHQAELLADMDEHPIQGSQWNTYEITAPVHHEAKKIYLGCFLRGQGQLWADNFELFVRDQRTNNPWKPVKINNPGFETDKEGIPPTGWTAKSELYAYEVTSTTSTKGKKSVSVRSISAPIAKPLFPQTPKVGDFITRNLGQGLCCQMPIALYGDKNHTYPVPDSTKYKTLENTIKQEDQLLLNPKIYPGDNLYGRLAGVVITWNVFRHFYPYDDEVKPDWNTALTESIESSYQDQTHLDFLKTLKKLSAYLNDGQAGAFLPGNYTRMYLAPLNWTWVQNQLVITQIFDKTINSISPGDVVLQIDGIDALPAIIEIEKTISGATPGWKRFRALDELLRGKEKSNLNLKVKKHNQNNTIDIIVSRTLFSPRYFGLLEKEKPLSRRIENDIYYLNLDTTPMSEINRLMPELQKCRSIICDFRGAPKGSHLLIDHLIKDRKDADFLWIPQIIYPDYEKVTYKKLEWAMDPLKPFLTARMIFIVDCRTMDYAESILSYIENFKLGIIIGEPTGGTNGSVNSFYLFGKYFIRFTGIKVVKHDGSPHHSIGIIPQIPVERTIAGISQGQDELLEKAIEIAKQ